jgi:glutamate synthase domain-containing protein 1
MRAGTDVVYLGGYGPSSLDFNDKYIVLGFPGAGYGRVEVRDRTTMAIVYQGSGDAYHRNMGRDVAVQKKILEPSGIEAHYIHYSSMRYESERVSYFHNGLVTLIETQKTVTTVT